MRRGGKIAVAALAVPIAVLLAVFGLAQTEFGRGRILALIEHELSDSPARLHAAALQGLLPFEIRLSGVTLSDDRGAWIAADHVTLDWSPAALLQGRLSIRELAADRIRLQRLPQARPGADAKPGGPLLPRLPVDVDLRHLAVQRLELGPEILGASAVFALEAEARLGAPARGLQAHLTLTRSDGSLDRAALDLDYRPAADTLKLDLSAAEPQGGLVTHLLGLAGSPGLQATIHGAGALTDWQARGSAQLDGKPALDLTARSQGQPSDRRITFDLQLDAAPLLPPRLAPLIAGGIRANGAIHVTGAGRPLGIDALAIRTGAVTATAQGRIEPDGGLDLAVDLRSSGSAPYADLLPPDLRWQGITARIQVAGPIATPKLTLDGSLADLAYAGNRIGRCNVSAEAVLNVAALRAEKITAVVTADSVTLAEPRLQPLVDPGVELDFAGSLDPTGTIAADQLGLHAGPLTFGATGAVQEWGSRAAHLTGRLDLGDLASVLNIAGLHGGGEAAVAVTLDTRESDLSAELDATASHASIGVAPVDRLLGPSPRLTLALRRSGDSVLTIDRGTLQSDGVNLNASGTMTADRRLDLKAVANISDLATLLSNAKGGIDVTAAVSGAADDPSAKLGVSGPLLRFGRITLSALQSSIDARALVSAPEATLTANGQVNGLPAAIAGTLRADFARQRVDVAGLKARLGGTTAEGRLGIAARLAEGEIAFASGDLGEIAALFGQRIDGTAQGRVTLGSAQGRQSAALNATAKSVRFAGVSIVQADLQASVRDVLRDDPGLNAALAVTGVQAWGRAIDRLAAKASGTLSAWSVSADAAGPDTAAAAAATVKMTSGETAIDLAKLDLSIGPVKAALLHPAEIALRGPETRISGLALGSGGGSLALEADLAPEANAVTVKLAGLPLSLLEAAASNVHPQGTLDGAFTLSGPRAAPAAALVLKGRGLGVQGASQQLANLDLDGDWRGGQFNAKGRLALAPTSALDFDAGMPMAADPATGLPRLDPAARLTARAQGKIDLGILNAFIPGGADHVAGLAALDLTVRGDLGRPVLAGKAEIRNGRYENARYGTRLLAVTAELDGAGSQLRLVSLAARTPDGGTLGGSGAIDFGGAMPVNISIRMDRARMIDAPIGTAVADGTLAVSGSMTGPIALSGKVKIVTAEIRIPDRLPATIDEIPVTEVNLAPEQAARLAAANAPPPKSLTVRLDLGVDAPGKVFVRGRGLDAELGGNLAIRGTADRPVITGGLDLKRGDFNLLSRRLQFNHGHIAFPGGERIDPALDFTATTRLSDAEVTATVTGTATRPKIALSSTPALPEDEILARLLFGKAAGALSPFEAVQLAQAAAELAGVDTGTGVLDKLRKTLGLDRLNVEAGEGASAPSLSAGRYVAPGVFVGAKQGATVNSSAATVEIEVTPHVKVETEVGADSSGKAGVNLEWDY